MKSYRPISVQKDAGICDIYKTDEGTLTLMHASPGWKCFISDEWCNEKKTFYLLSGQLTLKHKDMNYSSATLVAGKVYTVAKGHRMTNDTGETAEFIIFQQTPHAAICDYVSVF